LYEYLQRRKIKHLLQDFPRGLPSINEDNYFLLEQGVDGLVESVTLAPNPFLAYYHFMPPHFPYNTRVDFHNYFKEDGFLPPHKPEHLFARKRTRGKLNKWRASYDEFILYCDAEFARLYHLMNNSGLLENTWLILTSDHGELFERGIVGHITPAFHQPVIRIPLVIFPPGQKSRQDIYTKTSAIDLLPTLLHLTGGKIPGWSEGKVLPPYLEGGGITERDIFAFHAKGAGKDEPFTKGTAMLVRGDHKLNYYFGYKELGTTGEMFELYNIKTDPQELQNLYQTNKDIAEDLTTSIKGKLSQINKPFL
jgi:arylsulfatase A-like enzyme